MFLAIIYPLRKAIQLVAEEQAKYFLRRKIEAEAAGLIASHALGSPKKVDTTDIETDDPDIERRVQSFNELSHRLAIHLQETAGMTKGSDYKTSIYIRKLNLLAKKGNVQYCIVCRLWIGRGGSKGVFREYQRNRENPGEEEGG